MFNFYGTTGARQKECLNLELEIEYIEDNV